MTIEERADAYVGHPEEIDEFTSETIKRDAYIRGAKEQKAIDDAECVNQVIMGKGSAISHYKQGYHDAVEKVSKFIDNYVANLAYPVSWADVIKKSNRGEL